MTSLACRCRGTNGYFTSGIFIVAVKSHVLWKQKQFRRKVFHPSKYSSVFFRLKVLRKTLASTRPHRGLTLHTWLPENSFSWFCETSEKTTPVTCPTESENMWYRKVCCWIPKGLLSDTILKPKRSTPWITLNLAATLNQRWPICCGKSFLSWLQVMSFC